MPHRRLATLLAALTICAATALPVTALSYERLAKAHPPVVETGAQEFRPAADGEYVAWMANTPGRPNHFNAYFSQSGAEPQRVNPPGTQGWTGGVEGAVLVYTEVTAQGEDLVLYDMASDTTTPLPDGVNTGRTEHNASISGDYLLFDRDRFTSRRAVERIVLFNTDTDAEIVLAEADSNRTYLESGQVNGNWVVYFFCRGSNCNTFRYDILGEETTKVPNPGDLQQYSPSVSDGGTVFFVRSPPRCGHNIRFMSWDGATNPDLFLHLPEGRDSFDTFFDDSAGGSVYYERLRCRNFASDIYSEPVP